MWKGDIVTRHKKISKIGKIIIEEVRRKDKKEGKYRGHGHTQQIGISKNQREKGMMWNQDGHTGMTQGDKGGTSYR